ncbi:hypothetical protein OESDEN_23882 [Oesophagostomum dentatum]|uniref:Uncharacterized protein n=1 Tax=Oesophagostomum dentatum TaxID=61180 RepID=A0A0B1RTT3_OESDE|nr:hypothetical protein OESDEN_23882 [Oesophagostomum dentatum]
MADMCFETPVDIDGIREQNDSLYLSGENFYFLRSKGFPFSQSSAEVLGSARRKLHEVVDARRPHYLSDEETARFIEPQRNLIVMRDGVVVRAQPRWNVPKDAAEEGDHLLSSSPKAIVEDFPLD